MHLLFDIGGTNLRVGISADGKELTQWQKVPTPSGFEDGIKELENLTNKLCNQAQITKISGGIAGILDSSHESLLWAPNLPGWIGQPFKSELTRLFNCEIKLQNDAALAGLGEVHYGAGHGYTIVAYLTVSTGVGGARIVNGKIDHYSFGFEPGQQLIDMSGLTLEKQISGVAISRRFQKPVTEIIDPAIWQELGEKLASGLVNIITLWSPDIIIIGGGMMNDKNGIILKNVAVHLQKIFPISGIPIPALVPAQLKDTNGLWGALAYA